LNLSFVVSLSPTIAVRISGRKVVSKPRMNRDNRVETGHPPRGDRYIVPAVCGPMLVAVALVFGQTIRHDFVNFDDDESVYENPRVTGGLTAQNVAWAFTHSSIANWIPLTGLSHMLDCQIYGLWAGGHHLTNVLLHAAAAILLFLG